MTPLPSVISLLIESSATDCLWLSLESFAYMTMFESMKYLIKIYLLCASFRLKVNFAGDLPDFARALNANSSVALEAFELSEILEK